MSITRMLRSPVVVFLTIASCVAGAPVQIGGENVGLGQAVYSQPELAEALARTYQALVRNNGYSNRPYPFPEWQHQDQENHAATRNLDHIGGSNLLRNLDHIGGSNLLRNLDHIGGSNLLRNLDHIGGSNLLRNLDHIGGGNLLRNIGTDEQSQSDENEQSVDGHGQMREIGTSSTNNFPSRQSTNKENSDSPDVSNLVQRDIPESEHLLKKTDSQTHASLTWKRALSEFAQNRQRKALKHFLAIGFTDDPSQWPEHRGTLDSIGGGNLLRLHADPVENDLDRSFDRIDGSNLLGDLEKSTSDKNDQSMEEPLQNSRQNLGSKLNDGFQDGSSGWFPQNRNLDHIGGANLLRKVNDEEYEVERNLDHIGGGNLLRQVNRQEYGLQRNLDHIGGGHLLRNVANEEHGLQRNLDHIGGEPEARGLNAVNGGHLMRQTRRGLDSLSGATFGESKRWDPSRKLNERDILALKWPSSSSMNRDQYDSVKRNFDEIDRTEFDSFVKRNLDEIDRTGWDSFVKRRSMNAYLASRQR